MEAIRSSETLLSTYKTTRRHKLQDHNQQQLDILSLHAKKPLFFVFI
jgi:hypothetical protein